MDSGLRIVDSGYWIVYSGYRLPHMQNLSFHRSPNPGGAIFIFQKFNMNPMQSNAVSILEGIGLCVGVGQGRCDPG